jgi:predicted NBD/HSP70 family sugar kinase
VGSSTEVERVGRPSAMVSASRAGELNRARVLKTLYAHGALARPELARLTGSTRATIGQIVQPLLEEGILREQDPIASGIRGGKPARPIWFSDDGWPVGAVLLLPGRAQAATVTTSGRILAVGTVTFGVRRVRHDVVVARLTECLREVTSAMPSPLRGIGIAVGGIVDTRTGDVVRVNLSPGLNGLAIGPEIARTTGVPVYVDHQPRAQVLGDLLFGAGRGKESFCSVYIGEGIGAGLILDGALHRGSRGAGGEVGHTVVDRRGGVCSCGLHGCWETVATTRWIRAEAARRGMAGARTMGTAQLAALAPADPMAAGLLTEYAANIALGIVNLQHTLDLELFILHGDPVAAGEPLRAEIEAQVQQRVFARPGGPVRIAFAEADDYATVQGAAAIVLSRSMSLGF